MRSVLLQRVLLATAACALALPAWAHPGHDAASGFAAGLLHPPTGIDHLLALLAVGLCCRQQGRGHWLAPAFLGMMALAAAAAPLLPRLPALELSLAATVLVLGTLAASALRLPPVLSLATLGVCGFLHGLAHGVELTGMASGAGFLLASALLMAAGALPGARLRRVAGAAVGAAGVLLLVGLA